MLALALAAAGAGLWGPALDRTFRRAGATSRNYAGRDVPRGGGVSFVLATLAAALTLLVLSRGAVPPAALLLAVTGYGFLGLVDDGAGDRAAGGFRGHWRALVVERRLTTGAVKAVFGAVLAGGLAAYVLGPAAGARHPGGAPGLAAWAVTAGVIALSANAANLLDVRPGRALKAGILALAPPVLAGPPEARPALAAALGAALALLPADLAGRTMLGDAGANALGAAAGLGLVWATGPAGRLVALAALVALHAVAERIPLSRLIEASGLLRALDRWGRPPDPQAGPPAEPP